MKKIVSLLAAAVTLLLFSCSSDDGGAPALFFKWTEGGKSYKAENVFTYQTPGMLILFGGNDGTGNESRGMAFRLPPDIDNGTYNLVSNNVDGTVHFVAEYQEGEITATSTSGTLTITKVDEEYIQGKFEFTAANGDGAPVAITKGSFRTYGSENGN